MKNADLRGAVFTFKSAEDLNLEGAMYDRFTVFNDDFNPEENGMIFEKSSPASYGAKSINQILSFYEYSSGANSEISLAPEKESEPE